MCFHQFLRNHCIQFLQVLHLIQYLCYHLHQLKNLMHLPQFALKKLAAQAHGEALTQLLTAWESKNAAMVPSVQDLGNRVNAATRTVWVAAIGGTVPAMAKPVSAQDALLRLEMAAEIPTPASHLDARRALQLQLLTRRNDPAPQQTWGHDAAVVLSSSYGAEDARRVQNTLKVLLKR